MRYRCSIAGCDYVFGCRIKAGRDGFPTCFLLFMDELNLDSNYSAVKFKSKNMRSIR